MLLEERREQLVVAINNMPEEKLTIIEELLSKINNDKNSPVEHIYNEAVSRYHETLQKLAK